MKDGVEQLSPGRWRVRITRRVDGKRKDTDRIVLVKTRAQAIAERARLAQELQQPAAQAITVAAALEALLPTLRAGTAIAYGSHGRKIAAAFGTRRLADISSSEVQRWLVSLENTDGTTEAIRACFSRIYRHAIGQGLYEGVSPLVNTHVRTTPKTSAQWVEELEKPPVQRALIGPEVSRFYEALAKVDPDLLTLLWTQYVTGTRFGEASALQWRDIDWKTGAVTIRRAQYRGEVGPPKNKKARVTAVGVRALEMLSDLRESMQAKQWPGYETWVFLAPPTAPTRPRIEGSPPLWNYFVVRGRVQAALKLAGLDHIAGATHIMRHTHVTAARALQTDDLLRDVVGHSRAALTDTYTDPSVRALAAVTHAARFQALRGGVKSVAPPTARRDSGSTTGTSEPPPKKVQTS